MISRRVVRESRRGVGMDRAAAGGCCIVEEGKR